MTVENITPITRKVYTGPGEYTFTFKVYDATTVKATHISATGVETILANPADYTVTLNTGTDGGHIDTTSPASSGGYLDIFRELPFSQDLDLVGQGKFDPETLERGFDEAIMRLQQMQATIDALIITSNWRGDWATGAPYYIKDLLRGPTGNWYVCLSEHISDVFSIDLAAGYWALALDITTIGSLNVPDPSAGTDEQVIKVSSGAYVLGVVDTDGLADSAVTADKIANSTITQDKIASFPEVVSRDIIGGDITTSSQRITVSAFGCWDSTGTVWLETSSSLYWDVPATNNLEVYLFAVRATSGGAISIKGYSTYAGPASDSANVNAYRFLSWARNNGSGALMPYKQVGDRVDWTVKTNRPVLASSVTGSWTSYNVDAVIPSSLAKEISYSSTDYAINFSLDGSTETYVVNQKYQITLVATPSIYLFAGSTTAVHIQSITLRR